MYNLTGNRTELLFAFPLHFRLMTEDKQLLAKSQDTLKLLQRRAPALLQRQLRPWTAAGIGAGK
jgi:hypothetical protein